MNIYVGNIARATSENKLREKFEEFGAVDSVKLIIDRETGVSKGFAFVDMSNDEEAEKAIEALNGQEFDGRRLTVNQARPKTDRPAGGSSFGGNRSGGAPRGPRRDFGSSNGGSTGGWRSNGR